MIYPAKRQVLIFYTAGGELLKDKQLEVFQAKAQAMRERDIDVHTLPVSEYQAETLKWKIPSSTAFTWVLVGKDGGEKLRADTVVSTEQLFGTIDAMPMRQREMKRK